MQAGGILRHFFLWEVGSTLGCFVLCAITLNSQGFNQDDWQFDMTLYFCKIVIALCSVRSASGIFCCLAPLIVSTSVHVVARSVHIWSSPSPS